jgi:acetate kinase
MRVLSIDRGSSSLKVAVFEFGPERSGMLLEGDVDNPAAAGAALRIRDHRLPADRATTTRPLTGTSPIASLLAFLREADLHVDAVGHRLVFGGADHEEPARVTPELLEELAALAPFDPLHMPAALAAIREIAALLPDVAQVACFDTAFHHRMPMVAQRFPLPRELWSEGVRRFGFHGLSFESIVRELGPSGARGRMIVAHLGSGASLAAIADGKPVDTTMGLTPLGGLMMGTRPGELDPGALLYLLRAGRYTLEELDRVLNEHSGLLGVSGTSADMRTLLASRAGDAAAAEAVELFVYCARKAIGAFSAALGGLDTLVFTGGVGEHAAAVRWEIARDLAYLGLELDAARNDADAAIISTDGSRVVVRVMETAEMRMIARHTREIVGQVAAASKP